MMSLDLVLIEDLHELAAQYYDVGVEERRQLDGLFGMMVFTYSSEHTDLYSIIYDSFKNENLDRIEWYDDLIKIPKYKDEL